MCTVSRPHGRLFYCVVLLLDDPRLFASDRFFAECRTFVRRADGSPAAAPGAHDDCVFAMAIAQQVRSLTAGRHRAPAVPETEQNEGKCAGVDAKF